MKRPANLVISLCCALAAVAQTPEKNQDSLVLKDFNRRVADYVKLHKAAQSEIHRLKPTKSSEAIEHHEDELGRQIREARRGAGQGDIFTTEIAEVFRRLTAATMQGPEAARIRQSLQHAAPVQSRANRINSSYPAGLPLQSTPPSILLNLPALRPEVEYQVVGSALVLRDVDANLVVDFIPDAIH